MRSDDAASSGTGPQPRPLVVTDDPDLLDDLLRLAAAAGVEVEVASHPEAARARWAVAAMVVVGADLAPALAAAVPVRRAGVVVAATTEDRRLWEDAVRLGAEQVVLLPDGERWLVDRWADLQEGPGRDGAVVGVVGGRGGAGASYLAGALALAASRAGRRTLLLDADPLGGGLDLLLGGEDSAGLRWPDLVATRGRVGAAALEHALPRLHELTVLSWDRGDVLTAPPEAMAALLDAGRRGFDLTVVDLPRRLDAASAAAASMASPVLLVVPAEVRAIAAATRVLRGLQEVAGDVRLVVRRARGGRLDAAAVGATLGLAVAAEFEEEREVAEAVDWGDPPGLRRRGSLARACEALLTDLPGAVAA